MKWILVILVGAAAIIAGWWLHDMRDRRWPSDEFLHFYQSSGGEYAVTSRCLSVSEPYSWLLTPCEIETVVPLSRGVFGYERWSDWGRLAFAEHVIPNCSAATGRFIMVVQQSGFPAPLEYGSWDERDEFSNAPEISAQTLASLNQEEPRSLSPVEFALLCADN